MTPANNRRDQLTLVLGSNGKTGSRVAQRLTANGIPVRYGSRSANPPFDWEHEETWVPAAQGVRAVYLTYFPDLAVPGAVQSVARFTRVLVGQGVERIVLLSGRGEPEAQAAEQVIRESGLEWTIVRASWFAQNFSENYLLEPVIDGEVVLPAGNVGEPFIDADDIAEVAAAALSEAGHAGQLYEVTGPRLLTFADAVAEISVATGRDIRYVQVSPEEYKHALEAIDIPQGFVWLLDYLFTTVLDGRNAYVADGVQRALGREPRDFRDYARRTAATGIWVPVHV